MLNCMLPGCITLEELAVVIHQLGLNLTEVDLLDMIREVDIDGNGTVEFHEFISLMARKLGVILDFISDDILCPEYTFYQQQLTFFHLFFFPKETETDEEMKEAFEVFDKDQNGFISPTEVTSFFLIRSLFSLPPRR